MEIRDQGDRRRVGTWQASDRLVVIPLLAMVVIAVVDILAPPDVHLGPLLVVAPAFTAAFAGPRLTGLIGALAVLTLVVIGLGRSALGTENLIMQISSMAALSVLLVVFCRVRERHEGEMSRIRLVSETAQRVLLPPLPDEAGPLRIASRYRAAEAHTRIGGDLYALARTTTSTRLIIGDVRGKGLATLSATAMLTGAFRAAAHRQAPLPELVAYLEGCIGWGLAESPDGAADVGEGFVTALVVEIPDDQQVLHLIVCGHPPPLLLNPHLAPTTLQIAQPAAPLGLGALSDTPYETATFPFVEGDLLLLHTDGLVEARDPSGHFYPLAERAALWSAETPGAFLEKLWSDLLDHVGSPPDDDVAVVAVRRASAEPRFQ